MKQKKVSVVAVTVNFNDAKNTVACIESFSKIDKTGIDLTLIVVDNGSTELESRKIKDNYSKIILIESGKNLGFAGGNNLGIKEALRRKCDYVLLINNDATVENKIFLKCLLASNEDIVAPLISFKKNHRTIYDFGGNVDRIFGRNTHINSVSPKPSSLYKPEYLSGACLFVRSKVFKKIKLLDDKYFLYYEDVDFCLRAKKAGFSVGINSKSKIFHHLSATASKFGKKKIKILADSHLKFCRKHLSIFAAPFYLTFNLYLRAKAITPLFSGASL